MKRWIVLLILSVLFVFTEFGSVYAQNEEEKKKDEVSSDMEKESREPGAARKVEERLGKEFNVDSARIDSLRKQKLGYGEIRHVLSLSKQMPGGINDENVQKIMDLRQGDGKHKEGWGKIAHDLGLKKPEDKKEKMEERSQKTQQKETREPGGHRWDNNEFKGKGSMNSSGSSSHGASGRHR